MKGQCELEVGEDDWATRTKEEEDEEDRKRKIRIEGTARQRKNDGGG